MSTVQINDEERELYQEVSADLWKHVAQDLDRTMLESEEFDLWLAATESIRRRLRLCRIREQLHKVQLERLSRSQSGQDAEKRK